MRNRRKILFVIIIILIITLAVSKYHQNLKKYEEYADEKLNRNFYMVCDYMIRSNAVIENAIKNEYIFETDLEYLNSQFPAYLRSLYEINDISRKFNEFDFFSADTRYNFNREYSRFYSRIDNLFGSREYDAYSTEKYQLTQSDLDVFKQSYEYTFKVVTIIKNHIEYYNMFDIVIETEETGRTQLIKEYKEEYLDPWPDNKIGCASMVSTNKDGTVIETQVEVPRYDYPKQPFIRINNKEWINICKEIYSLNIEYK